METSEPSFPGAFICIGPSKLAPSFRGGGFPVALLKALIECAGRNPRGEQRNDGGENEMNG
jgi:hypothetical protein